MKSTEDPRKLDEGAVIARRMIDRAAERREAAKRERGAA